MICKTVELYIFGNNKRIPSATSDVVKIFSLILFLSKYVGHIVSMIKPVYNPYSVIKVIMCFPVSSNDTDSK